MTFLSTPHVARYRIFLFFLMALLLVFAAGYLFVDIHKAVERLIPAIYFGVMAFLLFKRSLLLKTVSYDSNNFYITEKDQEEIIPLEAIRKVELKTMGGRWEVYFHSDYTNREMVVFLPSLLYPLNYKKIEAKIELFHQATEAARSKRKEDSAIYPGLASSSAAHA